MTLNRQLWLAIVLILVLAFVGTFAVSTLAAKRYLEDQLRLKNLDNATSLALSMSQMPKDEVTIELLLAAQFDAGHYKLIRLTDPRGETRMERSSQIASTAGGTPSWFVNLFPINVVPGIAQVQDGWRQYGTLQLESHDRFAYAELWRGSKQLLLWFLGVALFAGLLGTALLRLILRPLSRVVDQAEAIGSRHFITTPEPATLEFRRLVRSMNTLSFRVRDMLATEAGRVEALRQAAQYDPVSGLLKREAFMDKLDSVLSRDSKRSTGMLVILRLNRLAELNREIGHVATDAMLKRIGERLNQFASLRTMLWSVGRIGGTDFALLAPGETDATTTAQLFAAEVVQAMEQPSRTGDELPVGATPFAPDEQRAAILARTDAALAASEETGQVVVRHAEVDGGSHLPTDLPGWRALLEPAMDIQHVSLNRFPVVSTNGQLLHQECPVRLQLEDQELAAGHFIAWVGRLGWIARLDALVVEAAMQLIEQQGDPVAVNLSAESICDSAFVDQLVHWMRQRPDTAAKLWLDVPEHGALHHLPEFRSFCQATQPLRCQLGLKHAGPGFARISELHDLGLSHLKLDSSLSHGIDEKPGNQSFVRGLCTVVHSIGMLAIAEGISADGERSCMQDLGVDAFTGPAVRLQP